jgi:hypothetical protein
MRIQAPTYGFVGASTITTASTLSISGPPVAGTNATITNAYALNVESGGANFASSGRAVGLVNDSYIGLSATANQGLWFSTGSTFKMYGRDSAGDQKWFFMESGAGFAIASGGSFHWSGSSNAYSGADLFLHRDAAGILAQRNSTNAQTFRVYNTYTSSTSFENLQFKAVAGAAYQIGSAIGSAGGTNRAIEIGHYSSAGTFTSSLSVSILGNTLVTAGKVVGTNASTGSGIQFNNGNMAIGSFSSETIGSGASFIFSTTASGGTGLKLTPGACSGQSGITHFTLTPGADTNNGASVEATDVDFNLARTVQFATGALTTQRAMRIQAPTYSFVGASTITNATTLELSPPVAGTNATITNTSALVVNFTDTANTKAVRIVGPGTGGTVWTAFDIANGATNYFKVNVYGISAQTFEEAATTNTFSILSGKTFNLFSGNTHITGDSSGLYIQPQVGHNTQLRSGTNVQSLGVYGTYTTSTSNERVNIRGKASANFEIGPENGSAGGTLRGLTIGGYSAGSSTITPWLSFTSGGDATFSAGALFSHANGVTSSTSMWVSTFGSNGGFRSLRANGTSSAPTQVLTGDLLGFYSARGYHSGGAYHTNHGGYFGFAAAENFTSSAQGTTFQLQTTTNGASSPTERMFIDSSGVTIFGGEVRISGIFKAAKLFSQLSAEITNTPTGTTQTITLNDGNHQTLTLTSSTGTVAVTLTVPSNVSSGTLIVKQHGTTPRNITWAVSSGSIKWMGTQPTWSSDAVNDIRIVSWRYDGSVMYLMSTDKAA